MEASNRDILRYIRKARDRMHMEFMLKFTAKALTIALGLYLALVFLARFVPVYDAYAKGAVLTGALAGIGFLVSLFMTPRDRAAAMLLDSKGLCERTLTAYELINDSSSIAKLQREDALEHLEKMNINKEIKMRIPKKLSLISILLALMILASGFIPNPMDERAAELHQLKREAVKQQKEIDKVLSRVENNNKLTMEQRKEAMEALSELKKELKNAKNAREAEKALQRTENKIDMLKQKYTDKDLDNIIEAFSKNEAMKSLAETLKKGDTSKLKKELGRTVEGLKKLNSQQIGELSQNLSELAKNLSENPELAKAFYELSQKMAAGELGDMQDELSGLEEQIAQLMENDEFNRAMEEVMEALKNSSAQGNAAGSGNNQGQGTGQGQSQGQGNGNPGAGAGTGTGGDSEAQSRQGQGQGLGNKQPSPGDVREYEKIFTPSLVGGEGDKSQLKGSKGNEGQTKEYMVDNGMGIRGEMKPYDQIIGEYKEKAFQSIEGRQIPQGMQDIVKDYFSSLED